MSGTPLAPSAWLPALHTAQDSFADLLRTAELDAPVPACAPWTVADLALHLANIHRWAAEMASGGSESDDDTLGPRDPVGLHRFYLDAATTLRDTLRALGPDAPADTLIGPGPASFWHRRQLHETLIHRHDLATAVGHPDPIDQPALWADGVDEVLTMFLPRQLRLGRTTLPARAITLHATDTDQRWHLGPDTEPTATIAAPARTLALLLWHRTDLDDVELVLTGDHHATADALGRALTP